jgi:hypothetical protein
VAAVHLQVQLTGTRRRQHGQIAPLGAIGAPGPLVPIHKLFAGLQEGQVAAAAGVKDGLHPQRLEETGQLPECLERHRQGRSGQEGQDMLTLSRVRKLLARRTATLLPEA